MEGNTTALPKRPSQRVTRSNASQTLPTNKAQVANKSKTANPSKTSNKPQTVTKNNLETCKDAVVIPTLSTPQRMQGLKISETPKLKHNRVSELNVMSPFLSQSPGNTEDADSLRSKYLNGNQECS